MAVGSYSASRKDEQLNTAKYNVSLFSRLFIACQTREGDLENFFAHENQLNPPSLSDRGELRPAKSKSGIVDCLLPNEDSMPCESPPVDCKVFDGPALANILSPKSNCKSFTQYAKEVFIPYLKFNTKSVQRLDLVFDRYLENSLKTGTRSNRGTGVRRKVTENGILPSNWKTFLRCSENKKELFPFLSKNTIDGLKDYKVNVATTDENFLCNQSLNLDDIRPCNIKEADERMLLHVNHAAKQFSKHLIKIVDSNVIVISVTVLISCKV